MFKKIVKRLTEDESSLWYDHVEEQQSEFKEIKEIYDAIQNSKLDESELDTAEKRQDRFRQQLANFNLEG